MPDTELFAAPGQPSPSSLRRRRLNVTILFGQLDVTLCMKRVLKRVRLGCKGGVSRHGGKIERRLEAAV